MYNRGRNGDMEASLTCVRVLQHPFARRDGGPAGSRTMLFIILIHLRVLAHLRLNASRNIKENFFKTDAPARRLVIRLMLCVSLIHYLYVSASLSEPHEASSRPPREGPQVPLCFGSSFLKRAREWLRDKMESAYRKRIRALLALMRGWGFKQSCASING